MILNHYEFFRAVVSYVVPHGPTAVRWHHALHKGYTNEYFNKRQRIKLAKLFLERKSVRIAKVWDDIFTKLNLNEDQEDTEEYGQEVLEA